MRPLARPPAAATHTFPAPVRGWVENENLSANGGIACSVLENGVPLASTVRVRGGAVSVANIGAPFRSLLAYRTGATSALFGASEDDLFDVSQFSSSLGDPALMAWPQADQDWPGENDVWLVSVPVAPRAWEQQGGRYSYVQMDTGGGQFLVAANGANPIIYYDGQDWNPITGAAINKLAYDGMTVPFTVGHPVQGFSSGASATILGIQPTSETAGIFRLGAVTGTFTDNEGLTNAAGAAAFANGSNSASSAVTITGVDTATLSHLWVHANRIWAVQKDTLKAWYLPVDQIGGTMTSFSLGGVFQNGGRLLFGATWSSDSGSGFGDRCVFVTDLGEVAIYEGTNPSSADTWAKVGRYDIGRPVSVQTMRAGGDLLIATTDGIVPMSAVVAKDPAALSMAAVSYPVEPAWRRVTSGSDLVQMLKWSKEGLAIIGYPHRGTRETHVVNLQTGAWARWTGHDIQCMALHNDWAFFGSEDGRLRQMEAAGWDDGEVYVFRMSGLPDMLRAPGRIKSVSVARATFRALAPFIARLSVATDYRRDFPIPPNASNASVEASLWDVGLWDRARWDAGPNSEDRQTRTTRWRSIGRTGVAIGPQVQIACGSRRKPDAELVAFDLTYTVGGAVV